ncbi:MAG: PRC-barrel domain-containing protein [Alphaproteobacteria bacterium]
MNIRTTLFAGVAAMALAAPAFANDSSAPGSAQRAQSSAPATTTGANAPSGTLTVINNDDVMVPGFNIKVGDLEGMDVVGSNGEDIGDVDKVLADASGKPVAVSIDAGSFLQMNKKEVIMQISALQHRDGKLHTSMNKDQIGALPDHND